MPSGGRLLLLLIAAALCAGLSAVARAQEGGSASAPAAWAALPEDADQIIEPGDPEVRLRYGFSFTIRSGDGRAVDDWCAFSAPAGPEPDASDAECSPSGDAGTFANPISSAASFLQLRGPAIWADGGRRLRVGEGSAYPNLACNAPGDGIQERPDEAVATCWIADERGAAPVLSAAEDATEPIEIIGNVAPAGEGGRFWARFDLVDPEDGDAETRVELLHTGAVVAIFGAKSFELGRIRQVDSVALSLADPARDGGVARGAEVALELAVLNENGAASAPARAIRAITLRASRGGVSVAGFCDDPVPACVLGAVALREAARKSPSLLKALPVTFTAPGEIGTVGISASVSTPDRLVKAQTLSLDVSGPVAQLQFGAIGSLLNHDAPPGAAARDSAAIPLASVDAAGRTAALPAEAHITGIAGPDGSAVASGLIASVRCADEERLDCELRISVEAPASSALPTGTYAASVVAGDARGDALFNLAGPAASIRVSETGTRALGETLTLLAEVLDETGVPVADGTPVSVRPLSRGETRVVQILAPRGSTGKVDGGVFRAELVVVDEDVAAISFAAGDPPSATTTYLFDARRAMRPPACETTGFSNLRPRSFATWLGPPGCRIAELFGSLRRDRGIGSVALWNGFQWLSYSRGADGELLPGAREFELAPSDTVWLGG